MCSLDLKYTSMKHRLNTQYIYMYIYAYIYIHIYHKLYHIIVCYVRLYALYPDLMK